MNCPYCNHEFPMTWKRYFYAPMGRHVCPECQRKSRFAVTPGAALRTAMMVGIGAIPLALICMIFVGPRAALVGAGVGGLLTGIPLDKFYEGKYRKLEKCDDEIAPD